MEKGNIVTMLWGLKLSNLKMMSDEKCCGNNLVHPEIVKKKKKEKNILYIGEVSLSYFTSGNFEF